MAEQVPIFINSRDRVTPLRELVEWCEHAGQTRIYLVDNDSTYPALRAYLASTPHTVIQLGHNLRHKARWESGVIQRHARGELYVASDPDTAPSAGRPLHALAVFRLPPDRYPDRRKLRV